VASKGLFDEREAPKELRMVQTSFSVGDTATLGTVLQEISTGGTDAAGSTAYTITLTAAMAPSSLSVELLPGSSVTLSGPDPFIVGAFAVTGTVVTDLNYTGNITLDNGALSNVAVATNGGGTVTAGLFSGAVLGTVGDAGDNAINDGTVLYGGGFAAIEFDSGGVQNGWDGTAAALVSGVAGGVELETSGIVQNGGTIEASGTAAIGVYVGAGTVDNGQATLTAALITGGDAGVEIAGTGAVANLATIVGATGDGVILGSGSVANGTTSDTTALIQGGSTDNGVWINAGSGTVSNFATIIGGGASGVLLQDGGTLTNGASGDTAASVASYFDGVLVHSGQGSVFNYGTILADGVDTPSNKVVGVFLNGGGTVENLAANASIGGVDWGVVVESGSGALENLGSITATGTAGLGADLTAGGTITNGLTAGSNATIQGVYDGVRISAGAPGAGANVVNNGTISGNVGVDFASGPTQATGTLVNSGLIESTAGPSGIAVAFGTGNESAVLQPGGSFIGSVLGNNSVGNSTTLELANGTTGTLSGLVNDSGTATDSSGSFSFSEIGTIQVDVGATWSVATGGTLDTVINNGGITVTGGTLVMNGPLVSGGGSGIVNIGSAGAVAVKTADSGQTFDLTSGGTGDIALEIGTLANFAATIGTFTAGDTIILQQFSFASMSFNPSIHQLSLLDASSDVLGTLQFGSSVTDLTGLTVEAACFAAGTRIGTARGPVKVEDLRLGDRVRLSGRRREFQPIVWLGRRTVICSQHDQPSNVWPVRIKAGAFGKHRPRRDLFLSPDHAVLVEDVLVPVKYLIDGTTIEQIPVDEVTYYHVELPRHSVLLAEGLPAESYLDIGDRAGFVDVTRIQPHSDPVSRAWEAAACAPLVITGARLASIRQRLTKMHAPAVR
jgi:Hint domain